MTLQYACGNDAEYAAALLGAGSDLHRTGAKTATFNLCQNHSEVFAQIDQELVSEGWASAYMGKTPARIFQ
jgi:hypothetical protein